MMRRALDAAEPARYALLGLLLDGPSYGYDLARRFTPGSPLGDVVHLSPSHLYALLTRLERDGLIDGERQDSGARPPRHVYRLTEAGRAAVLSWLDEPVARPRDILLDFPLKLYLARRLSRARAADLVAHQRAIFRDYLQHLESDGRGIAEQPDDATFMHLIRAGRILRTQATLEWLDRCAAELAVSIQDHA
jgi:DNA-binding PadR family transcriptional regulator